mmetsp:Transcript_4256/g.8733  ORF Transcript_4256/g.8733 Transcript_4256/m.8733 type:complete len:213 (-) Transcript_4256:118-756(-)
MLGVILLMDEVQFGRQSTPAKCMLRLRMEARRPNLEPLPIVGDAPVSVTRQVHNQGLPTVLKLESIFHCLVLEEERAAGARRSQGRGRIAAPGRRCVKVDRRLSFPRGALAGDPVLPMVGVIKEAAARARAGHPKRPPEAAPSQGGCSAPREEQRQQQQGEWLQHGRQQWMLPGPQGRRHIMHRTQRKCVRPLRVTTAWHALQGARRLGYVE